MRVRVREYARSDKPAMMYARRARASVLGRDTLRGTLPHYPGGRAVAIVHPAVVADRSPPPFDVTRAQWRWRHVSISYIDDVVTASAVIDASRSRHVTQLSYSCRVLIVDFSIWGQDLLGSVTVS